MAMATPGHQECRQNERLPARLIDQIRIKLALPAEFYTQAVLPVIVTYATHVHAQVLAQQGCSDSSDVLMENSLTVASLALDYRRGCILPPNAAPEVIGEHAHRWTYAVWVTALLYREMARPDGFMTPADSPLCTMDSGELKKSVASGMNPANEWVAHPLSIFRSIVPKVIQDWIGDDKALIGEIHGFLSGDPVAQDGPVGMLVARAVTEFRCRDNAIAAYPGVAMNTGVQVAETASAVVPSPPAVTVPVAVDPGTGSEDHKFAYQFMRWVSSGITDSSIRINDAAALVHFVEEGMLLVSPRIFWEFARQFGEDGAVPSGKVDESRLGMTVQSELLRAGWHQPSLNGNNTQTYDVVKHRRLVSSLSGVLITSPERFIRPVPAVNPVLVRVVRS